MKYWGTDFVSLIKELEQNSFRSYIMVHVLSGILLPPTCKIIYVNMQHDCGHMQITGIYANVQHIFVEM